MNDPAIGEPAQLVAGHSQKGDIVRQQLPCCRNKQGEPAAQNQAQPDKSQQRNAVADQNLKKSFLRVVRQPFVVVVHPFDRLIALIILKPKFDWTNAVLLEKRV